MGRFDKYNVDLKGLKAAPLEMEFDLDNAFFGDIDGEEFQKGSVKALVKVKKNRDVFDFSFELSGTVVVPCDRCLDDLEIDVDTENELRVKLGDDYADDGDIVIVGKCFAEHRNQSAVDFHGDNLFVHLAQVLCHGTDAGTDFEDRVLGCGTAFLGDPLGNHRVDQRNYNI